MQINKSRNNKTYKRVQRRCSLSLAKQHSSLSDPLCFCHSSKAGSKTELLNQRLGNMPGFQAQAVKGPLCPLQSFTGTADSRSETAFQASLVSVKSPLALQSSPLERLQPLPVVLALGVSAVRTPSQTDLQAAKLSLHAASWLPRSTGLPLFAGLLLHQFQHMEKKDTCQEKKLSPFQFYYILSVL